MKTSILAAAFAALVAGVLASPDHMTAANIESITAEQLNAMLEQNADTACGPNRPCNVKRDVEGFEVYNFEQAKADAENDIRMRFPKGGRGGRGGRRKGKGKGRGRGKGKGKGKPRRKPVAIPAPDASE